MLIHNFLLISASHPIFNGRHAIHFTATTRKSSHSVVTLRLLVRFSRARPLLRSRLWTARVGAGSRPDLDPLQVICRHHGTAEEAHISRVSLQDALQLEVRLLSAVRRTGRRHGSGRNSGLGGGVRVRAKLRFCMKGDAQLTVSSGDGEFVSEAGAIAVMP